MKKICVFCGASEGKDPVYVEKAKNLGQHFAEKNIGLVYGGASIGVMGAMADSCMEAGGEVYGIIPQSIIDLEVGHQQLTNLEVVNGMHERKARMYEVSDAFFAFPGGMGTLDELCEIMTWAQLQYHEKPCYVVNTNGFFDNLLRHFEHANKNGFISDAHMEIYRTFDTTEEAVEDFLKSF